MRLLDSRDPEQIECVFNCLAHMFKYLWAPIVKNINSVLPDLLPLLSCSKPRYINEFAAESFAFVARKVKDKPSFVRLSLKNVKKNQDVRNFVCFCIVFAYVDILLKFDELQELVGVARLFFEVITNVGQQLQRCAEEFLTLLLEELNNRKWSELLLIICETLMSDITRFVSIQTNVSAIWKSFFVSNQKCSIIN